MVLAERECSQFGNIDFFMEEGLVKGRVSSQTLVVLPQGMNSVSAYADCVKKVRGNRDFAQWEGGISLYEVLFKVTQHTLWRESCNVILFSIVESGQLKLPCQILLKTRAQDHF